MNSVLPWLQLIRAPAIFSAISNIVAAHLVASGGNIDWLPLIVLCTVSTMLLAAGMVLNDCFDLEIDRRERPGRPLPSGCISVHAAWSAGFGLLAAGIVLAATVSLRAMTLAAMLALAILLYDGLFKSGPLGPFAVALCRYLNWLLGLSAAAITTATLLLPLPLFFYICGVTWLSRTETGPADPRLVDTAIGFVLCGALAFAVLTAFGLYSTSWVLMLALIGTAAAAKLLLNVRHETSPQRIQRAVALLLLGIIPLDVLVAMANGIWWAAALLLLILPGKWLGRRLYVT